jgi:multisubunit Na+/H+ antiporter MnhG subunit
LAIVLFIYITSPTSTHVLMKAAFEDNHMPLDEKDLKKMKGKKE